VSANGDDGGFKPHPGDPWHPGFGEGEGADDAVQPLEEEQPLSRAERRALRKEQKRREKEAKRADMAADEPEQDEDDALPGDDAGEDEGRSWFRRRSSAIEEPIPEYDDDEDEGTPVDESLFMPPAARDDVAVPAVDSTDADLPSWLSAPAGAGDEIDEHAAAAEPESEPPADLPDVEPEPDFAAPPPPTFGEVRPPRAEQPVPDEPDADAPDVDAPDDFAVHPEPADDAGHGVASTVAHDAPGLLRPDVDAPDDFGVHPEPADDAGHGVASTAAYDALRRLQPDDTDEWEAFAEGEDVAADQPDEHLPPALDPTPAAALDPEPGGGPDQSQRRRRIFGRRRKDDEAAVEDELAADDPYASMSYDPEETQVMEPEELPVEAEAPSWVSSPEDGGMAMPPTDDLEPADASDVVEEPGEPLSALGGVPDVDDLLESPVDDAGGGAAIDPAAAFEGVVPDTAQTPLEASLADAPDGGPRPEGVAPEVELGDGDDDDAGTGRVPRSWFSDLDDDDDDEVEVEWPAAAAEQAPEGGHAPVVPGVQWGTDPADDMTVMEPIVVDDAAPIEAPMASDTPDDLPFPPSAPRPPEPLELGDEDEDEEWVEDDRVAEQADMDDWVTGPIEVAGDTEEMDADEMEKLSHSVYRGSVTTEHRGLAEEVARRTAEEDDTELQALSAAMPGLGTGVVGFEDVADLGHAEDEYVESARGDLGVRLVTATILLGLLLGSLWVAGEALAVFIGVLMFLGLGEFYATLRLKGYQPIALFGFLGGGGALVGTWFFGPVSIPVAIIATAVLTFFFYAFAPRRRDALTNGGLTVLGVAWVACTAAFAYPILDHPHYKVLVFAVAAAVMASDIGAYFFGRTWGSSPLAPILSPNKSIEGLAGGVIMAIGVAVLIGRTMEPFDIKVGAALGLMVALLAPIGDLAESMVKRSLGVKDMGSVLPGHGGILDRVDAFLFVLPGAWVLFVIAGLI